MSYREEFQFKSKRQERDPQAFSLSDDAASADRRISGVPAPGALDGYGRYDDDLRTGKTYPMEGEPSDYDDSAPSNANGADGTAASVGRTVGSRSDAGRLGSGRTGSGRSGSNRSGGGAKSSTSGAGEGGRQYSDKLFGLELVFWGLIIELIGTLAAVIFELVIYSNGTDGHTHRTMWIMFGIGAAGFLVVILGLHLARNATERFGRARIYYALSLAVWALMLFVASSSAKNLTELLSQSQAVNAGLIRNTILFIIFFTAGSILSILCQKSVMGGCAVIARRNENKKFMRACVRSWLEYLLCVIFCGAMLVMLYINSRGVLAGVIERSGGQIDSMDAFYGQTGGMTLYFGLAMLGFLLLLLVRILIMYRVRRTYQLFNRK